MEISRQEPSCGRALSSSWLTANQTYSASTCFLAKLKHGLSGEEMLASSVMFLYAFKRGWCFNFLEKKFLPKTQTTNWTVSGFLPLHKLLHLQFPRGSDAWSDIIMSGALPYLSPPFHYSTSNTSEVHSLFVSRFMAIHLQRCLFYSL